MLHDLKINNFLLFIYNDSLRSSKIVIEHNHDKELNDEKSSHKTHPIYFISGPIPTPHCVNIQQNK